MAPTIRYCRTPAGRVAYSAAGAGPPLLCDTGWVTHLTAQLELFSFGRFVERLAERFTVIRYDKPGCGLSERDAAAPSFDRQVEVALAVGATLVPLPGASHLFYHGEWSAVLDATLAFLGEPHASQRLTRRELEVAGLVAEGLTNQAIASRLAVAPRTAEAHVENIRRKLEVRSRAQIAAWVTEYRLSHPGPG